MVDLGHHYLDGEFVGGRFLTVRVWLADEKGRTRACRLLVDTASDRTVVVRWVLDALGLRPFLRPISPYSQVLWDLLPGTDLYRIDEGLLGQFWFRGWTVLGVDSLTGYLPTDMNVEGILGMEWLAQHFRRVCLVLEDDVQRLEIHE